MDLIFVSRIKLWIELRRHTAHAMERRLSAESRDMQKGLGMWKSARLLGTSQDLLASDGNDGKNV
jgi:hypothetical protein